MSRTTTYDELPYDDLAFSTTHPSRLAALAVLCGVPTLRARDCRVLELGCGTGFNQLAMAQSLPTAKFVGIDLSQRQIEHGRSLAAEVGVRQVELRVGNLLDLDPELGEFDFVVANGVYSWVPGAVRDAMLAACRRFLAPTGLAFVSYNTYPGWRFRAAVRDALRYLAPVGKAPLETTRAARAGLDRLVESLPDPESLSARVLRSEVEHLRSMADTYVFHEFLEEVNEPCWFADFAASAKRQRLRYVGDALYGTNSFVQVGDVARCLGEHSTDLVEREQYHDFLRQRIFRRSLLCREEIEPTWSPTSAELADLWVFGAIEALDATFARAECTDEVNRRRYRVEGGHEVETDDPYLQAMLDEIGAASPEAIRLRDLELRVAARLGHFEGMGCPPAGTMLGHLAARGYAEYLWTLAVDPPFVSAAATDRPTATALARRQARHGGGVVNQFHDTVELDAAERSLLACLDGTRSRVDLARDLSRDPAVVDAQLARLARLALFTAK